MTKYLVLLGFLFGAVTAEAQPPETRQVHVGGIESLDACGGYGIATVTATLYVIGTDGNWHYEKVDASSPLYICDAQDDEYSGVVIPNYKGQDCQVSSPIKRRQPYTGPCRPGWINTKFVDVLAG